MFQVKQGVVNAVKSPFGGASQRSGSGSEVFDRALKNPFEDPNEDLVFFAKERAELPPTGFK